MSTPAPTGSANSRREHMLGGDSTSILMADRRENVILAWWTKRVMFICDSIATAAVRLKDVMQTLRMFGGV